MNTELQQRFMLFTEDHYRRLFENALEGIFRSTPEGRLLDANPALARLHGFESPAAMLAVLTNLDAQIYVDPERRTELTRRLAVEGEVRDFESQIYRADGSVIWISENVRAVRDVDGQLYYEGFVQDITERKRIEADLRDAREHFEFAMQATADAVYDWNLVTGRTRWNHGLHTLFGYPVDSEQAHLWWRERVHPDDLPATLASIDQAIAKREPFWSCEYRYRRNNGSYAHVMDRGYFFYNADGKPYRQIGAMIDMTDRVQAQQLLEQRVEERTRELASLLQISRTVVSTLELGPLLQLILEQLQTVIDYTGASVLSLEEGMFQVRAYRGPGDQAQYLQVRYPANEPFDLEIMQTRRPLIIPDVHADTPQAKLFQKFSPGLMDTIYSYVHSWMRLPLIAHDTIIGMLTLHHHQPDYFSIKHADLALAFAGLAAIAIENARLYEQARSLAALEERQRLARELHDSVTQSLYSLTLLAEAGRRTALAGDLEKVSGFIARLGETAQQALKEMRLLVFELRPLALETEGLADALQHRLDAVEKRAGVQAQLRVENLPDLPTAVEHGLYRLAQEVLNNALKHSGATTVTVTLRSVAGFVELEIADNGKGFEVEAVQRSGGGLGLVSIRERTESLGGRVSIQSQLNAGTQIRVTIPLR